MLSICHLDNHKISQVLTNRKTFKIIYLQLVHTITYWMAILTIRDSKRPWKILYPQLILLGNQRWQLDNYQKYCRCRIRNQLQLCSALRTRIINSNETLKSLIWLIKGFLTSKIYKASNWCLLLKQKTLAIQSTTGHQL
jgi:hypothetical protein